MVLSQTRGEPSSPAQDARDDELDQLNCPGVRPCIGREKDILLEGGTSKVIKGKTKNKKTNHLGNDLGDVKELGAGGELLNICSKHWPY